MGHFAFSRLIKNNSEITNLTDQNLKRKDASYTAQHRSRKIENFQKFAQKFQILVFKQKILGLLITITIFGYQAKLFSPIQVFWGFSS